MDLKESFVAQEINIRGQAVGFNIDVVKLPNGKFAKREYLDHPGAVTILAFPTKGKALMVRQYRHPVKQETWELPAGKIDANEPPLTCVQRELEEETGYRSKAIKHLVSFWPTPAFSNEIIHIYTATKLAKGQAHLDEDEFLRAEEWPLKKILQWIRLGKIQDSKTVIAILAYLRLR